MQQVLGALTCGVLGHGPLADAWFRHPLAPALTLRPKADKVFSIAQEEPADILHEKSYIRSPSKRKSSALDKCSIQKLAHFVVFVSCLHSI